MKTTLPTYLFNILFPIKKEAIMPWEDTQGNPLDYNQKQCIKSPQTRQINSSTSPFRFHVDPGLHLLHTRISHALPPGSEEIFQVVFGKRTACLHEKTSLFNLFCISFKTYLKFDRILIYNALLLLPVSVSAMLPLFFKQEYLALSSKKDESRNSFSPYSRSLQGTFA